MSKFWKRALIVATISLGLPTAYAFAGEHEHGRHDRWERHEREARHHEREHWRAREEARDRHRRWEHERWQREHRADHRPPGWDHGRKTGWRGHDVPPGQYKKMGVDEHRREWWRHRAEHRDPRYGHPVIAGRPALPPQPAPVVASTQPMPRPAVHTWPQRPIHQP